MAKAYVAIQIDSQIYDLLHKRRERMSNDCLRADNGFGVGATIGMLLEHWEANPPSLEWTREHGALYPTRGRPRKTETGPIIRVGGKKDVWRGHQFVVPRARPNMHFCKVCDGFWDQHDYQSPLWPCPTVGASTHKLIKGRTKSQLRTFGFSDDEIAWALDE